MIGYRPLWCGIDSRRERGDSEGAGVRGRRSSAYSERAGEANICREQMNIGGLDVVTVAVGANTGQPGRGVEESVRGCGFGLDGAFQQRRVGRWRGGG
jgi:hypothetical protein